MSQRPTDLSKLVNPKERRYYVIMLTFSLLVYAVILGSLLSAGTAGAAGVGVMLGYAAIFALGVFVMHGFMIGHLRGNGVRVSAKQFPQLHRIVTDHARTLGMTDIPDVFILQQGGMLNAFATRFLGRDFVVLYSDVLAMAEREGERAVGFIAAHELAHVKRGHLRRRWLITPARVIPYLGAAYSRACEYTCDRFAAHCQPDGAVDGLLALAAGPELYRRMDARQFAQQVHTDGGFWVRRVELLSAHPTLPKRVAAIIAGGATVPSYSPVLGAPAVTATL